MVVVMETYDVVLLACGASPVRGNVYMEWSIGNRLSKWRVPTYRPVLFVRG